jgi:hypothetical protein
MPIRMNRPVAPPSRSLKTYYVYDPAIRKELGQMKVLVKDDQKVILMTSEQAGYWVAAGVIGLKPISEMSESERNHIHQLTGGRVTLTDDAKARGPVRNAIQDPSTTVDKVIGGANQATGKPASNATDAQREAARKIQNVVGAHEGMSSDELRRKRPR